MKIQVTAEDIANGEREKAKCCPIALACLRAELVEPDVCGEYSDGIQVKDDGEEEGYWRYKLPPEALTFVEQFDKGETVSPFEFDLGNPRGLRRDDY